MKRLKFILVDDNECYRNALKTLLVDQYEADILAEAANGDDALEIKDLHLADIILMDIMMPGKTGVELAKELLWNSNYKLKIIAITMHVDKIYLTTLIEAGFRGCISKDQIFQQLDEALIKVMNGEFHFPDNIQLNYLNNWQINK